MTLTEFVGTGETDVAPFPLPPAGVPVIANDAEALRIAAEVARQIAPGAAQRDQDNRFPAGELDIFSNSGLWGITVPRNYGGAEVSYRTLGHVIRLIAKADSAVAQLSQNHFATIACLASCASPEQARDLFALVLKGYRFGHAFSERGIKNVGALKTRLQITGDTMTLNGVKHYCTGALSAHLVQIVALDEDGHSHLAIAERNAPGLNVINDWSAFGQKGTASGTVQLTDVQVPRSRVIPVWKAYRPDAPFADSAISQFIQAAIDAGLADAAIDTAIELIHTRARPWIDSGQDRASDDPYTIQAIGALKIRLNAGLALLDRAGDAIDHAVSTPGVQSVATAQIETAQAKVLTTESVIEATNRLFELVGTSATDRKLNLDYLWRNARTHTLHDPVRWKYTIVGNYYLNQTFPPLHAWS
ncbi:SfnB family sulfur acquisition oxidoreductase [Novacetimonas hansenii]|mgnify:CR=1 FL=1|uniref:SfnB family sulfur acquisition oxidoreductase n=1 Tax=Novacetimonas hansenii TaxID=436 RepID=UPI00248F0640|nr:SfnB family sulfur acquisition oxidoreductase [Novacetimonas hansenii]